MPKSRPGMDFAQAVMHPHRNYEAERTMAEPQVRYRTAGGLDIRRLQPTIGAEITGVDLTQPIAPEAARDICQALLDHGVIFFRNQPISYAKHVALGRVFGEPAMENIEPDRPELMTLKSDAANTNPAGGHWHSDGTYLTVAHAISVLRCVQAAPLGGDTLFADARAAYEGLPEEVKARIAPLRATASMTHIRQVKELKNLDEYTASTVWKDLPDVAEHPVVRVHPDTGQPVLFVNECHTIAILDLDEAESVELLDYLSSQFRRPEYQMRWSWRDHDIAVWDNRAVQHYAVRNEAGPRHVERLAIKGTPYIGLSDVRRTAAAAVN
jgi:taurine dioxygenase